MCSPHWVMTMLFTPCAKVTMPSARKARLNLLGGLGALKRGEHKASRVACRINDFAQDESRDYDSRALRFL